jgi:hypothetical protein
MESSEFDEAFTRFQAFLFNEGWPTEIVWVDGRQRRIQASKASGEFDAARLRRLGVCLHALRVVRGSTLAALAYPSDAVDAEYLMYPADGGVKLSLAVAEAPVRARWLKIFRRFCRPATS